MKTQLLTTLLIFPVLGLAVNFSPLNVDNLAVQMKGAADPGTLFRGLKQNIDDVYPDQDVTKVKLTKQQLHQAQVWGLKKEEEQRYVTLMQNRSGVYWKNMHLSPVEILGINARNPSERQEYAALFSKQEQAKVSKELAWADTAHKAIAKTNQGIPMFRHFDVSPYDPYNYKAIDVKSGDKIFFLINLKIRSGRFMNSLIKAMRSQSNAQLNIYFSGNPDKNKIQHWAKVNNVPVKMVKNNQITLNTDIGPFAEMQNPKAPIIVLVNNGKIKKIDLSRF